MLTNPRLLILLFCSIAYLLVPSFSWGQTQSQTFNVSGTFTPPCGVTSISVQIWGGGGGGAGDGTNAGTSGSAGGGGGYSTGIIAVTPGVGVAITIGAAGAGGSGNVNGTAGGTSSVGAFSAAGGAGGAHTGGAGGAGGVGNTANGTAGTVGAALGGDGGTAGGIGGGIGGTGGNNANGNPGAAAGGGGGGGDKESGSNKVGGAGGAGRIIVTYTVPSAGTDQTLAACATTTNLAATAPPVGTGTWTCITNCTGVTITTPTSNTSGVTGLVPGVATTFRWTTTNAGCVASFDEVVVTAVQGPGCWVYCTPDFPTGVYSITNVTFETINNTSASIAGGTTPDDENFTGLSTNVTAGEDYTLTVSAVGAGAANTFCITAFFDWNNDGDYLDAGETIELGTYAAATITLSTTISVPLTATVGTTNFRIIQHFSTCATPCITTGYGQSENYSVIIAPDPCAMTPPEAGNDQNLAVCATSTNLAGNVILLGTGTWILISGSGTIASPNDPNSAVTNLGSGNNVFQWTVTPPGGCPDAPLTDQVTITTNGFPVVNAGLDQGLCFTNTTLTGSSLPAGATGLWTVLPAGPVINSPTTRITTVTGMVAGTTYTFTWTVTNACGPISDAMLVTVSNTVSPAVVGVNQTICPTSTTITATDPIVGVGTWTYVGGPAGSNITSPNNNSTTITSLIVGTYVFRWTVTDTSCVGSSSADITITVNNCQNPISHSATTDQTFTGCNFLFTDDGGAGVNYTEGIISTQTIICPDEPDQYVTISFSSLDLGINEGDNLVIFTSNNPAAPIYRYADGVNETTIPLNTTIVSDQQGECLIIQFASTQGLGASTGSGWVATTSCTETAPPAMANPYITSTNCSGGGGITICQDGTINPSTSFQGGQMDLNVGIENGGSGISNNGCLGSGESNEVWAYMTVVEPINPADPPGYIAFNILGANGQDFDFSIWGPYPYLSCPLNTGDAPIRCSWAATGQGGPGQCSEGDTGLGFLSDNGTAQADTSEPSGACNTPLGVNDGWVLPINTQVGEVYIMLINNYGLNNANFTFDYTGTANLGCDPPILLAIEMAYFNGYNAGNHNVLKWSTSEEKHSDFFTVEKSIDGYNWTTLGTVDATGNSQIGHNYAMYDNSPYAPTTYYRVKQTNLDGTHSYTRVIAIDMQTKFAGLASELFPNPTSDFFSFVYGGADFETPVQVQILNTIGQLVSQVSFEQVNQNQLLNVNTYNLPSGVYHVAIQQGEYRTVKKIVIQK